MKNTIILLFAKFFEKGIMFLFFMLLAQQFGVEEFGKFSYYFTIASVIFVFFDFGGSFYQIREFAKSESLKKFNTIFIIKTLIFLCVFIILNLLNSNIYLKLLLISFYLESILSLFKSSLYNNGFYILEAKFTILEKLIFIFIIYINILTLKSIILIYLSFTISKLVYIGILAIKFYKFKYLKNLKKLFDFKFFKYYIKNSWSYILHALLVIIFVQIDIIMLKQMNISFKEIGLYSAAVKIYMTVIIFADVLFKQYYPIVAKHIQNNEKELLQSFILKIQETNLFFSIYLSLLTMVFSKEIIIFAFGDDFIESSKMLSILSIIIIFRFSMYTYTAILSASNLNYIKLYTSLICVVVNIGLNYILMPIYGVYGAIIATVVTEFLLVILYKYSSFKIVFTNIISIQEIGILLFSFLMLYIVLHYDLSLKEKITFLLIMLFTVILNTKNIKTRLNFQKVTNE